MLDWLYLLVLVNGTSQVAVGAILGCNQVVAVDGGGDSDLGEARGDELQHCHLGGRILHRHTRRAQLQVRLAAHKVIVSAGVVQVAIHDLLGQSQGLALQDATWCLFVFGLGIIIIKCSQGVSSKRLVGCLCVGV